VVVAVTVQGCPFMRSDPSAGLLKKNGKVSTKAFVKGLVPPTAPKVSEGDTWRGVVAGSATEECAEATTHPIDLVKVRMQLLICAWCGCKPTDTNPRVNDVAIDMQLMPSHALPRKKEYQICGVESKPPINRAMIVTAAQMSFYDQAKEAIRGYTPLTDSPLTHVLASLVAGGAASLTSSPFNVAIHGAPPTP